MYMQAEHGFNKSQLHIQNGDTISFPLTSCSMYLGALQRNPFFQKSEFTMEVGGWVQVSLGIFLLCWKIIPFYLYLLYIVKSC